MTLDEFMAFEEGHVERHEFWGGHILPMGGESAKHHRVVLNLACLIADLIDGTSCQVVRQSMSLQVADGLLYPDVKVTCDKALAGDESFVTDPTLVIEVIDPAATGYDKRDKFRRYRMAASLREYVLADAATRQVEVFTRAEEGIWQVEDQSAAAEISLGSIGGTLKKSLIFKGVAIDSHRKPDDYLPASEVGALIVSSLPAQQQGLAAADMISADEAAQLMATTLVTIRGRIARGRAVGLTDTKSEFRLPRWQFETSMWELLPRMSAALGTTDGRTLLSFLESPHDGLGGRSPRQAVEQGEADRVMAVAHQKEF